MFSQGHESFEHQLLELVKRFGLVAAEDLDVLLGELECGRFEVKIAWGVAEHEAKVYVDHVTFGVKQDVAVVAVFDLENIAKQTVAGHRSHEVLFGCVVLAKV